LAAVYAISDALRHGLRAVDVALFAVFYVLSTAGITVGYHRLLAHGAFQATPALRGLLVIAGCMAGEGPPLFWVANHRRHHRFSDAPGDPHSPYQAGDKPLHGLSGFWHAHAGWMISHDMTNTLRYCPDLMRDQGLVRVAKYYHVWLFIGLLAPGLIAGGLSPSVASVAHGVLWGGLTRMFVLHHVTWSINSVAHLWGSRDFDMTDHSRNVAWLAPLSLGESWHNNHHAFPSSAHFGLKWYQLDLGAWMIESFRRLGLASNVRRPTRCWTNGVIKPMNAISTNATPPSASEQNIQRWLIDRLSEALSLPPAELRPDRSFFDMGLDSAAAVGLTDELSEWLDRPIEPTLLYDYPTIERLAGELARNSKEA
jgi:stearoyl-CoA desaturase (delta-9 desaturase)